MTWQTTAILTFLAFLIGCITLVVSVWLIMEGRRAQLAHILKRVDKVIERIDYYLITGD